MLTKNLIHSALAVSLALAMAGCTTPPQKPGMPQQGPGMPQQGPGMPQQGPGMPQQGPGMPQQGPGMPQQGPRMPQQGPGMPTPPVSNAVISGPGPVMPPMNPLLNPAMQQNSLLLDKHSRPVSYGQATLMGLNLNNTGNIARVKPGATIPAVVAYVYNCPDCKPDSINQIIIGVNGMGAESCIYNGSTQGQDIAHFNLTAPQKPGVYDIRFRYAQAFGCDDALQNWWHVRHAPTKQATVGKIIVQ